MKNIDKIRKVRLRKLENLRKAGMDPYPAKVLRTHTNQQALDKFNKLKKKISLVGRVRSIRGHGGSTFCHIEDGSSSLTTSGQIQIYLKQDKIGKKNYELFIDNIDIGDFIEVNGSLFKTKKGEKTLGVSKWRILTKSLLPLPEKWYGLKDKEERYRKRYLDLIMNPGVKEVFLIRDKVIEHIREFMKNKDYTEVQTPILQPIYGGGSARPFESKLNALDMKVYMRIANELYLKRLVVGGLGRVFEFSIDFRNEGIDKSHNPEFLLFEAMTAYSDYNDGMKLVEDITEYAVKKIKKTTKIEYQGKVIDFKKPWKRISVREAVKKYAGIDIEKVSDKQLKEFIKKHNIKLKGGFNKGNAIMELIDEFCEKHFVQPTILYDYPMETSPLSKPKRDNPKYAERFEQYVCSMELGNNYSELNDPKILTENWKKQEQALKKGDKEAQRMDKDFINALEIGMPPTCGIAICIDRFIMLLTDQPSIRDVIPFPFMRPKKK